MSELILSEDYWDCECDIDYIHSNEETACIKCGALREEQPPAREREVKKIEVSVKCPKCSAVGSVFLPNVLNIVFCCACQGFYVAWRKRKEGRVLIYSTKYEDELWMSQS